MSWLRRLIALVTDRGPTSASLQNRWLGEMGRIDSILGALSSGEDWTVYLLASNDGTRRAIRHLDSSRFRQLDCDAAPRDLRGIHLVGVNISGVDGLADTDLDHSHLEDVTLSECSLIGSSFRWATIGERCVLDGADFSFADLRLSRCAGASFRHVVFRNSDLRGARFRDADLRDAVLCDVRLQAESVLAFLGVGRRKTSFGGSRQAVSLLGGRTDPQASEFIARDLAAERIRKAHPLLALLWWILAGLGCSPGRLFLWTFVVWFGFGVLYAGAPLPSLLEGTALGTVLTALAPRLEVGPVAAGGVPSWFTPFYFSTVCLTTLGFGDVTPELSDWKAEVYVASEALAGYVLLAVFVSLLIQNASVASAQLGRPGGSGKAETGPAEGLARVKGCKCKST